VRKNKPKNISPRAVCAAPLPEKRTHSAWRISHLKPFGGKEKAHFFARRLRRAKK
jgi:hypothetical protein